MTPTRKKRLYLVLAMLAGVTIATGLAIKAFNENLMYFFSPTEVAAGKVPEAQRFRLGGMVVDGSVQRDPDSLAVTFDLTDYDNAVTVSYKGILPDLFREGQGIVAHGELNGDGVFVADEVLAKHDENYMPPEVAEMMEQRKAKEAQ